MVRIWLVPSRNLRVYGLSAPMAMVFPKYDQLGLLGANRFKLVALGGGAPTVRVARSTYQVAPFWSWKAIFDPSRDQAEDTCAPPNSVTGVSSPRPVARS